MHRALFAFNDPEQTLAEPSGMRTRDHCFNQPETLEPEHRSDH